jgi:nucleotide-binding universal stress UspA family protein
MFRRVLLPLDGSTFAEHALPYAVDAARRAGAELIISLVHVRHTPVTLDPGMTDALAAWDEEQWEREAAYVNGLAARIAEESGVAVQPRLLHGEVTPSLEREVRSLDIDLVVMATHGRGGFERAWLGSVADALVRDLTVPVLLVTPADDEPLGREGATGYTHLLIALDGSERAERCIAPALALTGDAVRVTLLRAAAPPSGATSPYLPHAIRFSHEELEHRQAQAGEYLAHQAGVLRDAGRDVETAVVIDYHPARAILRYTETHGADIIALATHGRLPPVRLLLGSVTDKVVRASPVPVLVC